jgi:hypothetical protein
VTRIAHIETTCASPAWLIEGLWGEQAVGFIGGPPKSSKTWLSLELAVAVASGQPCLGRYAVRARGPVLLYAAEDSAEAIKHRVSAVAEIRGTGDLERLAVGLITEHDLRLDDAGHQERLIATIEKVRPRLLVLDPLVRLHRSDENSASEVATLLDYLRQLQRQFGVAIVLVHHVRKSAADQPGQALRGSGDLHAWSDSSLYLLRRKGRLELHAEHRSFPSPAPVTIELGTEPRPHLRVVDDAIGEAAPPNDPLVDRIVAAIAAKPMTRSALREHLGIRNERLGELLTTLEGSGRVIRRGGLFAVPVPTP